MGDTHIAWTNKTWNPITGCTKVSQGCKHCYAETIANRMWATQYKPNADGTARRFTDVRLHPDRLEMPLHWRKPAMVFVNSMSDLFHEDVPDEFILQVFSVMESCPQHIFQVLTKRPERMVDVLGGTSGAGLGAPPLPNVWLGVSVEDQANADLRIPLLLQTPAAVRFLSCEPLLEALDLSVAIYEGNGGYSYNTLTGEHWPYTLAPEYGPKIDWVIVGGESGTAARPFVLDWGRSILEQCQAAGVPCFIKQLGARPCVISQAPKTQGAKVVLKLKNNHGGNMDEWPLDLRVREFPKGVTA